MPSVKFNLAISSTEYTNYYNGSAQQVMCTSTDGQKIVFPAAKLRPFVTHSGIYGLFEIEFDGSNKFMQMRKISS
jgi:hypothetical protein